MGRTKIAGFRRKSYKTLQTLARKTATFHHNINGMDVVQGELISVDRYFGVFSAYSRLGTIFKQKINRPTALFSARNI